ncbi:MAG TPA: PAS domain S-box protein [Deltaproteobacteria bacterium]|nr:PAS domain S-box protein [Deltaproteobacteria bacterium]
MDIFWIGHTSPPDDMDLIIVDSLDLVPDNALVFIGDKSCISWSDITGQRAYLVSDLPISSPLPEQVIGVIPRDPEVIAAISTLYSEMRESYDIGDKLIKSLNDKERAIAEKQKTIIRDSKRYNAIISNATDIIFMLGPTGKIIFCNKTLERYFEGESLPLIGKSFIEAVMDDDRGPLGEMLKKGFKSGLPAKIEVRLNPVKGKAGIFSLMSTPLVEDGRIYALSVIGRDITDIRTMQHRLSIQANDLTLMINGLAHELRNPLMVIGAYIRRIEKEDVDNKSSKRIRALSGINSSIKRIEDMIVQIEQYEAMVNMKPCYTKICLGRLVREAAYAYEPFVSIVVDADDDITAFSDYEHLRKAFLRILENAIETGTERVHVSISRENTYAYISVRDYGPGIKEELETIFAPFYSTDPMKTGLGLTETRIAMAKINSSVEIVPHANPGAIVALKILLDRRNSLR